MVRLAARQDPAAEAARVTLVRLPALRARGRRRDRGADGCEQGDRRGDRQGRRELPRPEHRPAGVRHVPGHHRPEAPRVLRRQRLVRDRVPRRLPGDRRSALPARHRDGVRVHRRSGLEPGRRWLLVGDSPPTHHLRAARCRDLERPSPLRDHEAARLPYELGALARLGGGALVERRLAPLPAEPDRSHDDGLRRGADDRRRARALRDPARQGAVRRGREPRQGERRDLRHRPRLDAGRRRPLPPLSARALRGRPQPRVVRPGPPQRGRRSPARALGRRPLLQAVGRRLVPGPVAAARRRDPEPLRVARWRSRADSHRFTRATHSGPIYEACSERLSSRG